MHLVFHDIVSLNDPRYDDYLDLYQRSFPPDEQELVSRQNRILRAAMRGENTPNHIFVAIAPDGGTAGMARYEMTDDAAVLWYLAVAERLRGEGLGSAIYAEVVRRVREAEPAGAALVYEVEDPARAADPRSAERRIEFYQRNGGLLLGGIAYVQSVGWQPPLPMCLMVHPFGPIDAPRAVALCERVFGTAVQRVDALTLHGIG